MDDPVVRACALFLLLAYFSLKLFTKTERGKHVSDAKRKRNVVFKVCGWTIVGSIVLVAVSNIVDPPNSWNSLFWLETVGVIAFEPLEVAARARQPAAKGLRRLASRVPGLSHGADLERVLRRATELAFLDKRRVLTSDDMFLALLTEDGPAKAALISLGKDPSAMRSEVMRSRPRPE